MVGTNKNFVNLFVGGNGSSKTTVGVNIVTNIVFGKKNFIPITAKDDEEFDVEKFNWVEKWGVPPKTWFDFPLYNDWSYLKRGRIISDPTTIKEKIVPELKKWLPRNEYKTLPLAYYGTSKESKQYEAKWIFKNGWIIDLMTFEQATTEFESVDLGFCWFDEPIPSSIFYATVSRMRRGGMIYGTMTPLSHSAWIKDDLIDSAEKDLCDHLIVDIEENCLEHGTRGILKHKDIERMLKSYPPEELEARARGRFGHLIGLVFPQFDRKIHVIEPFKVKSSDFSVVMACDPHPRLPDKATWIAIDRQGRYFVCDELSMRAKTEELAQGIKDKESIGGYRVTERLIDPSADWVDKHDIDSRTLRDRLDEDYKLYFDLGSKERDNARRFIADKVGYEKNKEGQMTKPPMLYVFNTCRETIREFENYIWDEWKGRRGDEKDKKQKPVDKNDHHIENIGRILLNDCGYRESTKNDEDKSLFEKHMSNLKKRNSFFEEDMTMGSF